MTATAAEPLLVIPAIDLKDGACVRLRQGKMADATVFSDDPVAMARRWAAAGARRLHVVDLDGAFAGKPINDEAVGRIAAALPQLPIQVGGGIRSLETIERYARAGVRYSIIGTMAVKQPEFLREACRAFPGQVIAGLDAKGGRLATDGWAEVSEISAVDYAARLADAGAAAIIYTDIERDGMLQGLNLESTLDLARAASIPVIASGGVTRLEDIRAIAARRPANLCGVITGRAIYEGTLDLREAQRVCDEAVE